MARAFRRDGPVERSPIRPHPCNRLRAAMVATRRFRWIAFVTPEGTMHRAAGRGIFYPFAGRASIGECVESVDRSNRYRNNLTGQPNWATKRWEQARRGLESRQRVYNGKTLRHTAVLTAIIVVRHPTCPAHPSRANPGSRSILSPAMALYVNGIRSPSYAKATCSGSSRLNVM